MTEKIAITEATVDQLRDFASIALGLELAGRENIPTLISKIQSAGYTGDTLPIMAKQGVAPVGREHDGGPVSIRGTGADTQYRIIIPNQERPGGSDPVQVGVNGSLMLIPRAKPVWIKATFCEVLQNAVEFVYDEDEDGKGLSKPREVLSYPFQYV